MKASITFLMVFCLVTCISKKSFSYEEVHDLCGYEYSFKLNKKFQETDSFGKKITRDRAVNVNLCELTESYKVFRLEKAEDFMSEEEMQYWNH